MTAFKRHVGDLYEHIPSGLLIQFKQNDAWDLSNAHDEGVINFFNANVFLLGKVISECLNYSKEIKITQELIQMNLWRNHENY